MKAQGIAVVCFALLAARALPQEPQAESQDALPDGAIARLVAKNPREREEAGPLAFSPQGKLLATSYTWGGHHNMQHMTNGWDPVAGSLIRFWLLPEGKQLAHQVEMPNGQAVHSLTFSPDGKYLAVAFCEAIGVYEADTGKQVHFWDNARQPRNSAVGFSADGNRLIAIDTTTSIRAWAMPSGKPLPPVRERPYRMKDAQGVAQDVSTDGRFVAQAKNGPRVWDAASGDQVAHAKFAPYSISGGLLLSPDGHFLSIQFDHEILVWDVRQAKELPTLKDPTHYNWGVAFVANQPQAISVGIRGGVVLWDLATGKQLARRQVDGQYFQNVAVSRDGRTFATSSTNTTVGRGEVLLWNTRQFAAKNGDGGQSQDPGGRP